MISFEALRDRAIRKRLLQAVADTGMYDLNRTFPTRTPIEWLADYMNRRRPPGQAFITALDCINNNQSYSPYFINDDANSTLRKFMPIVQLFDTRLNFSVDEINRMWRLMLNESEYNEFVTKYSRQADGGLTESMKRTDPQWLEYVRTQQMSDLTKVDPYVRSFVMYGPLGVIDDYSRSNPFEEGQKKEIDYFVLNCVFDRGDC